MRLWRQMVHWLTDDSLARQNYSEVEDILREVLETSRGDGSFDAVLRRVLEARESGSSEYRLPRFKQFMWQYHRRNAPPADDSLLALQILEDLPQIYGLPPRER